MGDCVKLTLKLYTDSSKVKSWTCRVPVPGKGCVRLGGRQSKPGLQARPSLLRGNCGRRGIVQNWLVCSRQATKAPFTKIRWNWLNYSDHCGFEASDFAMQRLDPPCCMCQKSRRVNLTETMQALPWMSEHSRAHLDTGAQAKNPPIGSLRTMENRMVR